MEEKSIKNKRKWRMDKGTKKAFFCVVAALLLFGSVSLVSADGDVDNIEDLLRIAESVSKPAAMVSGYALSPETLMPGDIGILTITLENAQDSPIEIILGNKELQTSFTMNAHIRDACLTGENFVVYNRYVGAGVIGPGKKIDFPFKIKAPLEKGVHMLKFFADIKNYEGKPTGNIDYYIPITVSSSVGISPLDVSGESIKLEVTNEGISKVDSVAVLASDICGIELQKERVYIGEMKNGESAIAVFNISKVAADGVENSAVFKAVYMNGINKHESKSVCVGIPFRNIKEEGKSPISTPAQRSTTTLEEKQKPGAETTVPGFELLSSVFMLVVVVYLMRKRAIR